MAGEVSILPFLARYQGQVVASDDIVDPMVAALTARATKQRRLPAEPEHDATELPMQMIWPENIAWRKCHADRS